MGTIEAVDLPVVVGRSATGGIRLRGSHNVSRFGGVESGEHWPSHTRKVQEVIAMIVR